MTEIKMPAAGQTTDEALIASVNVKPGDVVKRGDVLCEAETDKAVLPVESFAAGHVLAVMVAEGDTVTAGDVLVVIGKPGETYGEAAQKDVPAAVEKESEPAAELPAQDEYLPIIKGAKVESKTVVAAAPEPTGVVYPAMPGAKQLAKEKGIDIRRVPASNGTFVKRRDVESFAMSAKAADAGAVPAVAAAAMPEYEVLPMSRARQIIGRRMKESLHDIPCWQCTTSIRMDACMALRETFKEKKQVKLSYNDMLAKAIAVASQKYPLVNARYENDEVRLYHHTNVGLAVALDGALVVPVVKGIDEKGLVQIASAYKEQIAKAREGKLLPDDMGCGSITISNLGMYDVDHFVAIDNPPESCILAVASIKVAPEWDGEKFIPVHVMSVTGSFDHRIIDGAYGAQFLQEVKLLMENPALMLG